MTKEKRTRKPKRINMRQLVANEKAMKKETIASICTAMIMAKRLETMLLPEKLTKTKLKQMVKHSRMIAEMIADVAKINLLV